MPEERVTVFMEDIRLSGQDAPRMIAKLARERILRADPNGVHDVGELSTQNRCSARQRRGIGLVNAA
jgi:hypothetical protein